MRTHLRPARRRHQHHGQEHQRRGGAERHRAELSAVCGGSRGGPARHRRQERAQPPRSRAAVGRLRDDPTLTTTANNALESTSPCRMASRRPRERQHHPDRHRELRHRASRGRADGGRADRCAQHQERHPDQQRRGPGRRHPERPDALDRYALIPMTATWWWTPTATR